jgi:3-deoxy-D-manno-octulosonic-acid transferase
VVFVGKSLTAEGGQNPIEPALLGKPILFGPNMQNFEAIARAFVEAGAARQVRDEAELEVACAELLSQPEQAAEMGRRARQVVKENAGAIGRTAEMILRHWDGMEFQFDPVEPRPEPKRAGAVSG